MLKQMLHSNLVVLINAAVDLGAKWSGKDNKQGRAELVVGDGTLNLTATETEVKSFNLRIFREKPSTTDKPGRQIFLSSIIFFYTCSH